MDTEAQTSKAKANWPLRGAIAMIAFGAVAVVYVLFMASSKPETPGDFTRFAKGHMAHLEEMNPPPPQSTRALVDAHGAQTNLQAFRGQVTVVNLWATWCAPCVEEMPTLGALQRRFAGRLRVIPVDFDGDAKKDEAIAELARLTGGSLPFYMDSSRGMMFDAQAAGMPTTIIYDAQGRELARLSGGADWSSDDAAAVMEAALAEH